MHKVEGLCVVVGLKYRRGSQRQQPEATIMPRGCPGCILFWASEGISVLDVAIRRLQKPGRTGGDSSFEGCAECL